MSWQTIAAGLFPAGHQIVQDGDFLSGSATSGGQEIAVIGTCNHAEIGVEIALRQAQAILRVVREQPRQTILLLLDTQGQRLRHRDEMLGINSFMAHLAKCVQLARQQGHLVLALVYEQALSGGFLSTGLMADACYALPDASIRVMDLGAMARITKIPLARLQELAQNNPVFAPGAENFWRMGGLADLWPDDLATALQQALQMRAQQPDHRAAWGQQRLGRSQAHAVVQAMMSASQ